MDLVATGPARRRIDGTRSTARWMADTQDSCTEADDDAPPAIPVPSLVHRVGPSALVLAPERLAVETWTHNLPHALTSFVGRDEELAETRRLLDAARLLTLTGSGGVGKTRLGHAIAASQLNVFQDG